MRVQKSINLEDKTWREIDKARGDINRSKFVERIILEKLERKNI